MSETKKKSKVRNSNSESVDDDKAAGSVPKPKWSTDELRSLLDLIGKFATSSEQNRSYKATRTKIDWTVTHIPGRDGAECRETLNAVFRKVRRERSMREILDDARALLERGALRLSDKDKPACCCPAKKPSMFLVYRDAVLSKVQQSNPGMTGTDLMRLLGKMYKELSDKRKKKLEEEFKEREEAYKEAIEHARSENPDFECPVHFPDKDTLRARHAGRKGKDKPVSVHRGAPKVHRPAELYVAKKLESKNYDPSRLEELTAKYTRKYEALSDSKKLKWIQCAQQDFETNYREAAIAHWQTKPKFKPVTDIRRLLSPDERRILGDQKEKVKQPPSLYNFFTTKKLRELTDVKGTERLSVAAHMWKELSASEKKALEVEWHREHGDAVGAGSSTKSPSKSAAALKRKADESDESDSDSDASPKRPKVDFAATKRATPTQATSGTSKVSVSAAPTKSTGLVVNNNHTNKTKPRTESKPTVIEDSDSSDVDDDDEDDEPPKSKAAPVASKNAATNQKLPAKPAVNAVAKAPAGRQALIQNGRSSSDDDSDESDSDSD